MYISIAAAAATAPSFQRLLLLHKKSRKANRKRSQKRKEKEERENHDPCHILSPSSADSPPSSPPISYFPSTIYITYCFNTPITTAQNATNTINPTGVVNKYKNAAGSPIESICVYVRV